MPLTNWRFESPVSYWDFNHYGRWTLPTELLLTVAGCIYLIVANHATSSRAVGGVTLAVYVSFACFAALVWGGVFSAPAAEADDAAANPPVASSPASEQPAAETSE
ncbi:MAG: hypothetical protein AAGF31_10325 [Planctomycetota bacterium]